ncbi:MAG: 50S ribosomal protein L44e [Candidatus Micrarchaeia archaeon]
MELPKQISAYCPKCNKHTVHNVKLYSKKASRELSVGERRHERKLRGYVGKIKASTPVKKLAKKQKVLLECTVCHRVTERVFGARTKKKLEVKH